MHCAPVCLLERNTLMSSRLETLDLSTVTPDPSFLFALLMEPPCHVLQTATDATDSVILNTQCHRCN